MASGAVEVPLPPEDFAHRSLELRAAFPGTLIQISWKGNPQPNFRATGNNRFDSPDKTYSTLYLAGTLEVCFAETLLRGDTKRKALRAGSTFIPEEELKKRVVVQYTGDPLKMAFLVGAPLKRLGGDASVSAVTPYDIPQQWSKAVHSHPASVDGFVYVSRHLNDLVAAVVFDRAKHKLNFHAEMALLSHPEIGRVLDLLEVCI